jgi:hypothetical protein
VPPDFVDFNPAILLVLEKTSFRRHYHPETRLTFPFFWPGRRSRAHAEDRLGRLRQVLDQAQIRYTTESPELALGSLPASMPPVKALRAEEQQFRFPLPGNVRIALLEAGFRLERNMRESHTEDAVAWLQSYAPEALVMPLNMALSLADQRQRGLFELPSLRSAVVVLTSLADSPLAVHHRDLLWQAFGVPVFEQLRGWSGAIIAKECEVHDGLHIDDSAAILHLVEDELLVTELAAQGDPVIRARTGLTAEIVTALCECGAETPRLRGLSAVRAKAAIARA